MLHNNSRADLKRLRHTAAHGRALQHDIAKAEDLAHSNALLKRRNAELAAACAEAHRVLLDGRYAKRRSEMRKELEAMENKIRAKDAQTEALLKELKGGRAPLVQTRDRLLRKMEVLDHTKKPLLDKTAQDLRVEIDVLVQGRVQFESAEQQLASEIMPLLNERLQDEQMRRDTFSEHSKHTKQAIANAQTQIKAARLRIATTEDRQASMQQAAQDALKVLAEEKEHVTSLRLELRYVQAPNISGVHPGGKSQRPSQSPTSSSGTVSMVRGHHRRTSSVRASKEAALASQLHKEKIEAERLRHELAALKTESASAESGAKAAEEKAKQEGSARTSAELLVVRRQVREVRSAISQERAKLSVVERNNAAADVKLSRLAAEEKRMRSADKTNTGTSKRLAEEQDLLEKRAMALESKMEAARCHVGALSDAIARQETLLGVVRGDLNRERHDIGAKLRSKVNQLSSTIQSLEKSTPPREHQIAECRVAIAQLQQQQKILHDKIDKAREAHSSMTDRLDEADVRFRESKRAYDSDRSAALVEAQTRSQTQKEMRALVASCDDKVATLSEEVRLAHEALRQLEREHSLNETLLGKKQREIEFAKLAAERQREHEQSNRDKFVQLRRELVVKKPLSTLQGNSVSMRFMVRAYTEAIKQNKYFGVCDSDEIEKRFLRLPELRRGDASEKHTGDAHIASIAKTPPGKYIFLQGHPGNTAFVVLEGRANILHKNDEGVCTVIKELSPGDIVGEFSLFSTGSRTRTASVQVPSGGKPLVALEFSKDDLEWLGPPFSEQVLRSMRQYGGARYPHNF